MKEAFKAVFSGDFTAFRRVGDLDQLFVAAQQNTSNDLQPPTAYGQRGLPFAPGIELPSSGSQAHSLSGGQVLMSALAATLAQSRHLGIDAAQKERSIFQEALGKVSEFAQKESNKGNGEYQQLMGKMAQEINNVKANPEENGKENCT